jgi:hypothetical protein
MNLDLAQLNQDDAKGLVAQLLAQLAEAREAVERSERRATGIRKMVDGLVEMFPALEDLLPEDLDNDEEPRPRGAEAVRRVLADRQGDWFTVTHIVGLLDKQNWMPNSSNPANAVRTALERLVDTGGIEKNRSTTGAVIYRYLLPPSPDDQEEPF